MSEDLGDIMNDDSDAPRQTYPQNYAIYTPRSASPPPTESWMEAELAEAEQVVVATVQRNAELESSMRRFAATTFRLEESASIGAAIQNQREALIVSAAQSEVTRLSSMLEDASTRVLETRCEAEHYAYHAEIRVHQYEASSRESRTAAESVVCAAETQFHSLQASVAASVEGLQNTIEA